MNVSDVLAKPLSEELLTSHIPARFAYTGVDGDPRVIPIGFLWTGSDLKIYTLPNRPRSRRSSSTRGSRSPSTPRPSRPTS